MEVEIDEEGYRTVYINNDDQCMWCEQQYGCPLIECLNTGLVEYVDPITVLDCPHYKVFDKM